MTIPIIYFPRWMKAIIHIGESEPTTLKELSQKANLCIAYSTTISQRLEKEQIITRTKQPKKKQYYLSLTNKGLKYYLQLRTMKRGMKIK